MDLEQALGLGIMVLIVSIPIVIALLGPVIGGKKVVVRDLIPLFTQAINDFQHLEMVRKSNYQEFEDDMVGLLYDYAQKSKAFTKEEKLILNKEVIGILVRPQLKKIYNQK